jgi:hypothetical protein
MPLKVIGAGFGRTGTLSLCTALNQLGFPCYHMYQVFEKSSHRSLALFSKEAVWHIDFWHKVACGKLGTPQDWEQVFSGYAAVTGPPQSDMWRALLSAYPDAKVILTVHPGGAQAWYESTVETIYWLSETSWQMRVLNQLSSSGRKAREMGRKLIWDGSLKGTIGDRGKAIKRYHEHIAEVKATVPAEQLLVYSVDQGWKPLCTFLGVPEPAEGFPHANERAVMKRWIRQISVGAYAIVAVCALALGGLLYSIARMFF